MAKEKNKTEIPQVFEGELQSRLIKIREDAGYSTAQMADAMCLSEEVILNLENEAFELLAEPPYVRGYLRNYAKLSESDPSELIDRYETLRGADINELDYKIKASSHSISTTSKRLSPVLAQLILLAILLGGIAMLSMIPGVNQWFKTTWENFSNQLQTSTPEVINNPLLTGTMPVPIPLPESEETNTSAPESSTDKQNSPSPENTQTNESPLESDTPEPAAEQSQATVALSKEDTEKESNTSQNDSEKQSSTDESIQQIATNPSNTINLKLIFNKDVWLRIKNKDNKTVFEGLNKTGTDKTLEFDKPLTFRVGNAQGLSLFVDDKAIDISKYINGSIANFTLE